MSAVLPKCAGLFVIGSRMGAIVLCSGVLPLTFGGPQLSQLTGPRIGAWVWLKTVCGPARQITAASAPAQKHPPTEKNRSFESFSFIQMYRNSKRAPKSSGSADSQMREGVL